ncbi:hypothetical protein OG874_31630 [Nocardia sp. NBC_00565]|uniref:hypothetical protein n=1 Tax=Nocardia sp. NBC_00565 TaxID=2975993 RepID=UPI002E817957|nr:hypothetical protein [Nocardia sp. NBC_00565]WUC01326.1 hypothetical protein OG874_31630 [Nocardia sp. NBC_00565]
MRRDALRTTQTQDGRKAAVWQLVRSSPRILRVQLPHESFTAYRLPSRMPIPDAQPGTILFDADPDLADARQLLAEHNDLWDALRDDYWAALLCTTDLPNPLGRNTDD